MDAANDPDLPHIVRMCNFLPVSQPSSTSSLDPDWDLAAPDHNTHDNNQKQAITHNLDPDNQPKMKDNTSSRIMRRAMSTPLPSNVSYRLHIDGGANMSITNDTNLLINYRNIRKQPIAGISDDSPALYATGAGYLPWKAQNGEIILVKCFYSSQAADTIISPTDVVINKYTDFRAWTQHANIDDGTGSISFHKRNSDDPVEFPLISHNGLWFYHGVGHRDFDSYHLVDNDTGQTIPTCRAMSKSAEHLLYHYRSACPGETTEKILHKHVDDCPPLKRNQFFRCGFCMDEKCKYRPYFAQNQQTKLPQSMPKDHGDTIAAPSPEDTSDANPAPPPDPRDIPDDELRPGQWFQMDMGFVRGSGFETKDESGRCITSIDGYNSYLLIIDRKTRRLWGFLSKSKSPPIDTARTFLQRNKCRHSTRKIIRTDEGGELYRSHAFQHMADAEGFILQPTAPDAARQNGLAERPNGTLGNMMRCLLRMAALPPEYWSYALLHAIYIKNRLPHRTTGCTPYFGWTGKKPSAKHWRMFGCPVVVRLPGDRHAKLDTHTTHGQFLGFTATDHNIYYRDTKTNRIKIATHVTFDEAGMTIPPNQRTAAQRLLQDLGYSNAHQQPSKGPIQATPTTADSIPTTTINDHSIHIQLLSEHAKMPTRATDEATGYDLYSAYDHTILPQSRLLVATDIALKPPPGTYVQIMPRSGLALKYQIDTKAGVIDRDYCGNIMVLLHNSSSEQFEVKRGDRIAQFIVYPIVTPPLITVEHMATTERGKKGFGSTGIGGTGILEPSIRQGTTAPKILDPIPNEQDNDIHALAEKIIATDGIKPYDIWVSNDPFDQRLTVQIDVKGTHPMLGLQLQLCPDRNRLQLTDMALSTPGSRIPKWRSTLRRAYLISINGTPVNTVNDVTSAVATARQDKQLKATLLFATERSYGVHPIDGNLNLYFDQMQAFAKHIHAADKDHIDKLHQRGEETAPPWAEPDRDGYTNTIRNLIALNPGIQDAVTQPPTPLPEPAPNPDLGKMFTKKQLLQRPDWPEWQQSCYKQLDQYNCQGMFSEPMQLPANSAASFMLWTYHWKLCGTKKARMVLDGARNRHLTTFGHTYANSLDAPSERLFWALVAKLGLIAIGADVSNAFAEAPPPHAPCYMFIDDTFRDWWVNHLKRPPIPKECNVVRVCKAIQGHPESPRLWEKHIDRILREMHFTPARHEPCLYRGNVNGEIVLFLRQVDDFSVAAKQSSTCSKIIAHINSKMSMDVKDLGVITRFNGMDVHQTKHYIKLTCEKYIHKMLEAHSWLLKEPPPVSPLPLPAETTFIRELEAATPPSTTDEQEQLQKQMGFNYRSVIGELIWPMVKCRPDFAPHVIKLSQYLSNPARAHYEAARLLANYLAATINEGIYYWRDTPVDALPEGPLPTLHPDNYTIQTTFNAAGDLEGFVDSDWAADSSQRKSISGVIVMFAGGVIAYKSKYQEVIALSTTEAEFVAACDAAKIILFFRSILEDLQIPQDHATILFEDNNGALLMANAQQPTRRTRHMDIKHFSLLDWVQRDLVLLKAICTSDNAADAMTKFLPRQLFFRHFDTYMGRRIPSYAKISAHLQPVLHSSHVPQNKI